MKMDDLKNLSFEEERTPFVRYLQHRFDGEPINEKKLLDPKTLNEEEHKEEPPIQTFSPTKRLSKTEVERYILPINPIAHSQLL